MEQDKLAPEWADRERFERVWRRVMPEERPDCPFTLYGEGDADRRLMPPDGDVPSPEGKPAALELGLAPMVPMAPPPAHRAKSDQALLQDLIADELRDYRTYQNMARRVRGQAARLLASLSADERAHAKRLSVAYFLLSGVHFWPDGLPGTPVTTFLGGVRSRFLAEQEGERAYRDAAAQTADPALRELFLALAADEAAHAHLLRDLLERM